MITNILLCGVGGQGTILASNILSKCAMEAGFDVKKSEIHGMAQRGGSVTSHVRFGEKVYSPIIRKGECDIILSFEELESLRWAEYIKENGLIITNSQHILPMSVSAGNDIYPNNIQDILASNGIQTICADAIGMAKEIGNAKCLNVVLLGILAKKIKSIDKNIWLDVINKSLPEKIRKINLDAFNKGWSSI